MFRCNRVEVLPNEMLYYCTDELHKVSVFKKSEMIQAIQNGFVSNATTYIRNGIINIRVDGAIREKGKPTQTTDSSWTPTSIVEAKIINQFLKHTTNDVVYTNHEMTDILRQINATEFRQTKEAKEMTPYDLINKSAILCRSKGRTLYIIGIKDSKNKSSEIEIATNNKQKGCMVIQRFIKDKIIKLFSNTGTVDDMNMKQYLESEKSRIYIINK